MERRERSHCSSQEDEQEGFLEEETSSYKLDHEEETNAGWEKGLSEDRPPRAMDQVRSSFVHPWGSSHTPGVCW